MTGWQEAFHQELYLHRSKNLLILQNYISKMGESLIFTVNKQHSHSFDQGISRAAG